MKRRRVQLHLPDLYVGGIERWALTLMNGLPQIDWRISTPKGALTHQAGIEEFRRFTRVEECDTQADLLITTWGLANRPAIPTVAVAHSAFDKYRVMMQGVRYDFAVAVSQEACTCFPESAPVDIIYNGVDLSRLQRAEPRGAVRQRLGLASDAWVFGYVGRWGFQKNPLAAAKAAGAVPGAVALYVGPSPDDRSLVEEAARLAPCVFVSPEEVGNIGDLYAAMDLCVFASRTEGFGLAIAEAWYSRVPVIATRVGVAAEHPDLVRLLPQEPSVADLGDAARAVIGGTESPDLDACRTTVIARYSAERMVEDWRAYITGVTG